jgi:ABC-type multidrug transport system permease subunit
LNCAVFSALGLVAAMMMNSHEEMGNFNTYVLTPMSFLCATFFTPDHLPALLRWVIEILPLTHASYALRSAGQHGEMAGFSLGVLVLYLVALLSMGVWNVWRQN